MGLFYIHKTLDSVAGKVKDIYRSMSEILLLDVQNKKQAEFRLKANVVGSYPLHVDRYNSLNSSQEVTGTNSMNSMLKEKIYFRSG
jgi:hypothetical protein